MRFANDDTTPFKVPLIGDANAGKTSILTRFTTDSFISDSSPTVGVSTVNLTFHIRGQKVDLSIWDTAGQEKFRSLVPLYARHASIMILVFDISNTVNFSSLDDWLTKIRNDMGVNCPLLLCANKIDLPAGISVDSVKDWAEKNQCLPIFTSAMTGEGVNQLFNEAANLILFNSGHRVVTPSENVQISDTKKCC
jgi:small GTP-binding protein